MTPSLRMYTGICLVYAGSAQVVFYSFATYIFVVVFMGHAGFTLNCIICSTRPQSLLGTVLEWTEGIGKMSARLEREWETP